MVIYLLLSPVVGYGRLLLSGLEISLTCKVEFVWWNTVVDQPGVGLRAKECQGHSTSGS